MNDKSKLDSLLRMSSVVVAIDGKEMSEYERLRQQNIERNKNMLESLGFDREVKMSVKSSAPKSSTSGSKKRSRQQTQGKEILKSIPTELLRRSARAAKLPAPDYKEPYVTFHDTYQNVTSNKRKTDLEVDLSLHQSAEAISSSISSSSSSLAARDPPAADTSRALDANINAFLGDKLGIEIDAPLKGDIVHLASPQKTARFNKYSGVLEWKNACFLWVNVQTDADYPNKFLEGGKRMTWFGGSKMHSETPVVIRLANSSINASDNIILFVRFKDESYVSLGRVEHESSNLNARPVQFVWRLKDYDDLKSRPYFKRVLDTLS